jgi:two-component system, chemotaxis family, protein-glutamate methylesterase/glutaminase
MPSRDIVVIGASAGGVEALASLVRRLPSDLGAAMLVVLHLSPEHKSVLPEILSSAGPLAARHARNGESILPNRIYVARPDHHLLVHEGHVRVVRGPRENGHRPAIDPLFRTAAYTFGARVIGIVLSGALDDGTAGLAAIKSQGGVAIVQDPDDALVDAMPRSALENVDVDHVLSIADLGKVLPQLVVETVQPLGAARSAVLEEESALQLNGPTEGALKVGQPSSLVCPDCGGVLNEVHDGHLVGFRCRVGHAFAPETLYTEQRTALEGALWAALRALEEQAALSRRMAVRAREFGHSKAAIRHDERAHSAQTQARTVRDALRLGAPKTDAAE